MSNDNQSPYTSSEFFYAVHTAFSTLTKKERHLLRLLYESPDHTARSSDLSIMVGETHHGPVNAYMARISRKLMKPLGVTDMRVGESGKSFWFMHIAAANPVGSGWSWTLFPELVQALEETGVFRMDEDVREYLPEFSEVEFLGALNAVAPSEKEIELLVSFVEVHDGIATASELAHTLGWHYPTVNKVFGFLARRMAEYFGIIHLLPTSNRRNGRPEYWQLLSGGRDEPNRGFVWVLHESFKEAIYGQPWCMERRSIFPEEVPAGRPYVEGASKRIEVNAYERDGRARRACIRHYGAKCSVCDLVFEDRYGPATSGIIHVHHLRPLHEIREEYVVDPVADLIPVCPNCHAVMHSRHPEYSVGEVREMMQSAQRAR